MSDQKQISGRVTLIGYYHDTLPRLVVTINKENATLLPALNEKRIPINFCIQGETFQAGIRTTLKSATIYVCPDLSDSQGNIVRLADLLLRNNIQQKTTVTLVLDVESRILAFL